MPLIGTGLLFLAALAALVGTIFGIVHPHGGARPDRQAILRICQVTAAVAALLSLAALAWLVAQGRPDVAYALENRAPESSGWGYRISAVWAGQAGGLLLWCVETALIGLFVSARRRPTAVAVLFGIESCLLVLAALSHPFAPPVSGEGAGLNPLLQDPMMLIHPPMLFLGYALLAIPFALTAAALLGREPQSWPADVRPWVLVGWLALTAGNGFGALWAYNTFGWGGFWSWDAVENTSFVPWVLAGVTLHALWLSRRAGRWLRVAAICALGGFIAVLYGSFLARSGVLAGASVHAYVEGRRLLLYALTILLTGGIALSVVALARGWRAWMPESTHDAEGAAPVAWGNGALLGIAGLVLVGMSLPIVGLVPTTSAYNTTLMPLALIMMAMVAYASLPRAGSVSVARGVAGVAFSLTVGAIIYSLVTPGVEWLRVQAILLAPLLLAAAVAGMVLALVGLIRSRRPFAHRGSHVAHFGVGALLAGALLAGYLARSESSFVSAGLSRTLSGHEVTVREVVATSDRVVRARVQTDGRQGWVETEQNERFNTPLRHAWVLHRLWGDLYVTPMALMAEGAGTAEQGAPSGAMLEVTVKPGMPLVWLGIIAIALGAALALTHRIPFPAPEQA